MPNIRVFFNCNDQLAKGKIFVLITQKIGLIVTLNVYIWTSFFRVCPWIFIFSLFFPEAFFWGIKGIISNRDVENKTRANKWRKKKGIVTVKRGGFIYVYIGWKMRARESGW